MRCLDAEDGKEARRPAAPTILVTGRPYRVGIVAIPSGVFDRGGHLG